MRSPTSLVFAAHVLAVVSPAAADLPTDSDETVSSIWLVPDATQDAFTTTLKVGDFLNLQWAGTDSLSGDTTADLWLAAYAYSVSDSFSQLLTKGVDLSVGGTFNWTVSIPQPQLDATPHYVLTFKSARTDFQFNASDPGLPSPGVSVIENDGDGLAEDNGTDGGAAGSGVTILSSTGTNSTTFDTGADEDDDDDDDSDSDSDSDDEDDDDDDDDEPAASGNNSGNATASNTSLITTTNATCGGMFTCLGSTFGDCCSQHNFCGSTVDYCGAGCLSDFGHCDPEPSKKGAAKPLSVAATAGIASGVSVGVVGLGAVAFFWWRRRRAQQKELARQEGGGPGNGNYLGDGSSAVYRNGGTQRPYLMLETGRNGPLPNAPLTPNKSLSLSSSTSPDSTHPPTENYSMAAVAHSRSTSTSTPSGTLHPGTVSSSSIRQSTTQRQSQQQASVYEMEGGEQPFRYGESPPVEMDATSIR